MKMEDGFVYMTREEIAEHNAYQRLKMALETYGPLKSRQLSYLVVGGTIGERTGDVCSKICILRQSGEVAHHDGQWRLV